MALTELLQKVSTNIFSRIMPNVTPEKPVGGK